MFTFQKKQNLNNKYIFIFEDFKLSKNLIHKEDYYFKKVKDFFPNYKNIIIGFKIYNDKKNFSILQLTQKKEALKILIISILIYIKFLFLKNQIFKKTNNFIFWKNYHFKNNFINFYLANLTFHYFKQNPNTGEKIFYPYEEKPYERALNAGFDEKLKKKIFAYQVNPKDELGLYLNKFDGLKIPRAKKYLFTGKECARNFLKKGRKNFVDLNKSIIGTSKFQGNKKISKKKSTIF